MRWQLLLAVVALLLHPAFSQEDPGDGTGGDGTGGDGTGDAGDGTGDAGDGTGDAGDGTGDAGDGTGDAGDGTGDAGDGTGDAPVLTDIDILDPLGFKGCTTIADCTDHAFAQCMMGAVSGTDADGATVETEMLICKCDGDENWEKDGAVAPATEGCRLRVYLDELCNPDPGENDAVTVCADDNTSCVDDGTLQNMYRCLCDETYFSVMPEDTYQCAKIMTSDIYPDECGTCEGNGGTCYALDEADLSTVKCMCPPSRSGEMCATLHMFVKCNTEEFTMELCYVPHEDFNYAEGARMYASGYGNDEACKGKPVPAEDNPCVDADGTPMENAQRLVLPMRESERARCGTIETKPTVHKKNYHNIIALDGIETKLLKTTCLFDMYVKSAFQQVGLNGINQNDVGESLPASIEWKVQNNMRKDLAEVAQLKLGDNLRFIMDLQSGTYSALLPVYCSASSSPTMPDLKAVTVPLIIDSCPAPRQEVITKENMFRAVTPSLVETGFLRMFRLSQGNSIFIHCLCRVCLLGSEDDCAFPECPDTPAGGDDGAGDGTGDAGDGTVDGGDGTVDGGDGTDGTVDGGDGTVDPGDETAGGERRKRSLGRRRRDTIDNDIITAEEETLQNGDLQLTKQLVWYTDAEDDPIAESLGMSTVTFAILIVVLFVILVLFILLGVFLYMRSQRNTKVDELSVPHQPQRFAMPRINRTDQRI